jgi:hypothetical protein
LPTRRTSTGLALEDLGRVAGDHVEVLEAGEVGDDVLGDPVREAPGRLVPAEVVEREHRDRGPLLGRRLARPEVPHTAQEHEREQDAGGVG